MLFKKITVGFVIAALFLLSACAYVKGSIDVQKNEEETELVLELKDFNAKNECQLYLTERDTLKIDISLTRGSIALEINGKKGSQPYTGQNLGFFTVTVSESDEYVFRITGKNATGKVMIKNLGNTEK